MFNFAGYQLAIHFISLQLSASVVSQLYFFFVALLGGVVDQLSMDRGVETTTSLSDFGLVVSQRFNYVKPDYLL